LGYVKIKIPLSIIISLVSAATSSVFADDGQPAVSATDYSVRLQYGDEFALTRPESSLLYSNVVECLRISNFNSSNPKTQAWPEFQVSGVQADYHWVVSRKYILVTFKEARTIGTLGGSVKVRKIVIGLNLNSGRNQVFTIDDKGRVISYAKYGGAEWLDLLKIAKKIAGGNA
jgi:hypothetical protein